MALFLAETIRTIAIGSERAALTSYPEPDHIAPMGTVATGANLEGSGSYMLTVVLEAALPSGE